MLIRNLLKLLVKYNTKPKPDSKKESSPVQIKAKATDNTNAVKQILSNPTDLIIREIKTGSGLPCAIACIDGMVDKVIVNDQLIRSLQLHTAKSFEEKEILPLQEVSHANTLDDAILSILSGDTLLFVDGFDYAFVIGSKGWKSRSVQEPQTEALIRGPRDGFTEDILTNTASIRRRIRDPHLRFDAYKIGRRSKRDVVVAYIDGIVHPELVKEVKRRLETFDVDDPEGSGAIEQWLMDDYLSPFPQILSTERPDKLASGLVQGRVAIIVDGTPFQLIMPITLITSFQSPEDFYQNWMITTLIRMLRMLAAFIATFLPALYIALVEFHHGMLPSKLAFSIAGAREGVPFPAFMEAFVMEATLELLREAGIRLPKPIGQTIGIVGGLVIGEAAVQAGIVSPIMVIVVAITAIASFSLPSYSISISLRTIRFGVMIAAALFGLYGIILAYIMLNIHIVNLRSFGIPYSTPFAPLFLKDFKDVILRAPITQMDERPQTLQTKDMDRMEK